MRRSGKSNNNNKNNNKNDNNDNNSDKIIIKIIIIIIIEITSVRPKTSRAMDRSRRSIYCLQTLFYDPC